jgi:hypothetical protein
MKAKLLVTIIEEYNSDWSRQSILNEIEYIQTMMYNHPTMLSRAYSTDVDGVKDPQFTVDVNNEVIVADASRIELVYESDPTCPIKAQIQFQTIRFKDSFVGRDVRVRCYKQAPTSIVEGMELLIPDQHIPTLEAGVVERLAYKEHRDRQPFLAWERRELPRYWARANRDFRFNADEPQEPTNPYGD